MEDDYERLSEILREAIEGARSEAIYISNQYSILRLSNIDEAIVDKVDEALTKSPEKLKPLTELIIPKLEKLLKLTGPNKVDNEILGLIAHHIRYDIQFDDPNYINDIQTLGKSLDLLSITHYILQSTYLGIVYDKFTPPGLEFYLREKMAISCVKNTVDDLFKNPEKHKQLIEEGEGKYIDTILNEFCKKY